MLMISYFATLMFFIAGAAIGSFGCCQVWRIRKGDKSRWSHCMNCKYRLQWYDNVPIFSWLLLGGKCRKCRKPIGWAEFLAEIGTAAVFALSYWFWPFGRLDFYAGVELFNGIKFALFLFLLACFVILFVYDAKWKEMPTNILWASVAIGVAYALVTVIGKMIAGDMTAGDWLNMGGSLLILPGFYFLLYMMSNERWVGGGDWILCLPLALFVGDFWLSMFILFGSNLIGSMVMLPVMSTKKGKKMKIPFGPFLIMAFLIVFFVQASILRMVSL